MGQMPPFSKAWGGKSFLENSGKRCRSGAEMVPASESNKSGGQSSGQSLPGRLKERKKNNMLRITPNSSGLVWIGRREKDQCFTRIARIHTNLREQKGGPLRRCGAS